MPEPRSYYQDLARSYATQAGIDPEIFLAQINQESGFDPLAGPSSAGAQGIAQIMPGIHTTVDPWDPDASLQYAANLMAGHLQNYGGDIRKALTAYHAGPGNLNKAIELGGADWESYMVQAIGEAGGYANQIYLTNILGGGPLQPITGVTPQLSAPTRSPFFSASRADVRRMQQVSLNIFGRPSDEMGYEPFPGFSDLIRPFRQFFDNNAARMAELSAEINSALQDAPSRGSSVPSVLRPVVDFLSPIFRPHEVSGEPRDDSAERETFNAQMETRRAEYDTLIKSQGDLSWLFAAVGAQLVAYSDKDPDVRTAAQAQVDEYISEGSPERLEMLSPILEAINDYVEDPIAALSDMTPEEIANLSQQEIEDKLYTIPRARPVASYTLSTDQLRTSLKGFRSAGPDELATGEQLRQLLMQQGLDSEEAQLYRHDTEARVKELLDQAREEDRKIEAMRTGEGDWMLPKPGVADYLKAMAVRPIFVASQALDKYFTYVVEPATGAVVTGVAVLTPGEQKIERDMALAADEGNFWTASGEAWRANTWHPAAKFAVETIADPTTYIGWGIAPKLLRPIPILGRRLSAMAAAAEYGYVQMANTPFRIAGRVLSTVPKPISTLAELERGRTVGLLSRFIDRANPSVRFARTTGEQTTAALGRAVETESRFPAILADEGVQIGKILKALPAPDADAVVAWSQRMGGNLTRERILQSRTLLLDLDTHLIEAANNPNRAGLMARQIMTTLGIEDTVDGKGFQAAKAMVDEYVEAGTRQANQLIQGDSMYSIMDNIGEHAYQLTLRNRQSQVALQAERTGIVSTQLSKLAEGTGAIWSGSIEKFMIRPLARSYLLFGMYHLWNVAETRGKLIAAGVNPFRKGGNPQMHLDTWADVMGGRPEILLGRGRALVGGETVETTLQASKGMDKFMAPTWLRRLLRETTATRIQANDQALFIHKKAIAALKRNRPEQWNQIQRILDEEGMDFKFLPKDLRPWAQEAAVASIISGPETVRGMAGEVTAERLRGFRVANMLSKYDLLDDVAQEYVTAQARSGRLFTETQDVVDEVINQTWEKHLRSPEFFATNFEDMVEEMAGASIANWEDLAKRIQVMQGMSRGYGEVLEHQYRVAREASEKTIHAGGHDRIWGMWRRGSDEFGDRAAAAFDRYISLARSHISAAGERTADVELLMSRYQALKDLDAASWAQRRQVQEVLFTQEAPAGSKLRSSNEWWRGAMDRLGAPFRAIAEERKRLMREIYGLESKVGGQPRFPVPNTSGRALSRVDMAVLYGVRPDDISAMTFLTDLQAIQGRDAFIEDAMSRAILNLEPGADLAKLGWNEERLGQVWDDIMREFRLDPKNVSVIAPTLMQVEDMKKQIMGARLASELSDESRTAFEKWANTTADRLGQISGYAEPAGAAVFDLNPIRRLRQALSRIFTGEEPDLGDFERLVRSRVEQEFGEDPIISLYRGVKSGAEPPVGQQGAGLWWTTDIENARGFAREGGNLYRVEVRASELANLQRVSVSPDLNEVKLAQDIVERARAVGRVDVTAAQPMSETRIRGILELGGDGAPGLEVRGNELIFRNTAGKPIGFAEIVSTARGDVLETLVIDPAATGMVRGSALQALTKAAGKKGIVGVGGTVTPDAQRLLGRLGVPVRAEVVDEVGTSASWLEGKSSALKEATDEFYQTFPDYIDLSHLDTFMRAQFPFWVYEFHRLFYLPRQFMRTPGLATGLGRYNEATGGDNYMHVPGTSLEINPLRGTILMGGLRRLLIQDYPEFYDTFPGAQQALDISGRFGFYPGAHVNVANILFGTKTPQFGQIGEIVPAWMKAPVQGFQAFANLTGNETMQGAAKRLADVFIPERYRDYMIALKVSDIGQVDPETGAIISGADLLNKRISGAGLSESEQNLWDSATGEMSATFILMDQTAMFRFRPEEMDQARAEMNTIVMEYTGLSEDQLTDMRNWGYRWQDVFPPSPEMRELLNATESLQRWSGFTTVLFGASQQEFRGRRAEFWVEADDISLDIKSKREVLECRFGFAGATSCDHPGSITTRDYLDGDSELNAERHDRFESLRAQDRYKDIPVTNEQVVQYYKDNNIQLPLEHSMVELFRMYHEIELEDTFDPETGRLEPDYATFYAQREMLLQASGERRDELETQITRYETGLGMLHRFSYEQYLRPYYARRELTLSRYSRDAQLVIRQWLAASDRPLVQQQLEQVELDGERVVSNYQEDMRTSGRQFRFYSPFADAWLAFWQVTSSFRTDMAQGIYEDLMRRYRPNMAIELPSVEEATVVSG